MNREKSGIVSIRALLPTEISNIIEKLEVFAHMNISYSEFRDMVLNQKVFKIMFDSDPFGVVAISKEPLPKIKVWLSDKESKEDWIKAIEKAANQAFIPREVNTLTWLIAKSQKEMISCASSCGFENIGDRHNEGPNGETMIAFELSKTSGNGNSAKLSLKPNLLTQEEKDIKDGLERRILSLKKEVSEAEKSIESLQKSLLETDEKRRMAENDLLLLKESIEKSSASETPATEDALQQEIAELKAANKQIAKDRDKFRKWLEDKRQQYDEALKTINELQSLVKDRAAEITNGPEKIIPKIPQPANDEPLSKIKDLKEKPETIIPDEDKIIADPPAETVADPHETKIQEIPLDAEIKETVRPDETRNPNDIEANSGEERKYPDFEKEKIPFDEIETRNLMSQLRLSNNSQKIIIAVMENPGCRKKDLEAKTGIINNNLFHYSKEPTDLGLIIKNKGEIPASTRISTYYPVKNIVERIRELVKEKLSADSVNPNPFEANLDPNNSRILKIQHFLIEKSQEKEWRMNKIKNLAKLINYWLEIGKDTLTTETVINEFGCCYQTSVNWMDTLESISLVSKNQENETLNYQLIKDMIPPEISATETIQSEQLNKEPPIKTATDNNGEQITEQRTEETQQSGNTLQDESEKTPEGNNSITKPAETEMQVLIDINKTLFRERINEGRSKTDRPDDEGIIGIAENIIRIFLTKPRTSYTPRNLRRFEFADEYSEVDIEKAALLLKKAGMASIDGYYIKSNILNTSAQIPNKAANTDTDTSPYGIVISELKKYGEKGVNGKQFCEEVSNKGIISYDSAAGVLRNLEKQGRLKIVVKADTLLNSIIAYKF